jgi:hypothetical protein
MEPRNARRVRAEPTIRRWLSERIGVVGSSGTVRQETGDRRQGTFGSGHYFRIGKGTAVFPV